MMRLLMAALVGAVRRGVVQDQSAECSISSSAVRHYLKQQ